jgi:hypothetical protein
MRAKMKYNNNMKKVITRIMLAAFVILACYMSYVVLGSIAIGLAMYLGTSAIFIKEWIAAGLVVLCCGLGIYWLVKHG